ncbi:uncharacterized protein LOC129804981 [Phlebotomus papatasi]|uniref:uncharacterized protein LOC129804981 n=1 Tax=Phlebotomus papatasi TaxID=29031 RepID=UPI002483D742|nr:uncharacterized protein LOC129804981 [Phlebotomus papatasi]
MPKKLGYSEEALKNALDAVKAGESSRKASAKYGVPKSTLNDKLSGKQAEEKFIGKPVLGQEKESQLVEWIVKRAESGFPVVKSELQDTIRIMLKNEKMKAPFTNSRPGRFWFKGFLRRNPEVSLRVVQNLTERRAKITKENLDSWFLEVREYLTSKGLTEIAPNRIFNCDESGFAMSPKGAKVLAKKGAKSVHGVSYANDHENITCLFMASADGDMPPPLVLFSYKRVPGLLAKTAPDGWAIGSSNKGWMTGECFYEYIVNTFYPWLIKNKVQLPVVLYVDGHKSHLTLPLSEFCSNHGIEVCSINFFKLSEIILIDSFLDYCAFSKCYPCHPAP